MNKFRIVSRQFGYPMYATADGLHADWTDNEAEAHVYDEQDSRETKLKFWRSVAHMHGLDPTAVQIEDGPP